MKSSFSKDKAIRKIYYRDKRQKNSFYRDLDLKRLRTTDLEHRSTQKNRQTCQKCTEYDLLTNLTEKMAIFLKVCFNFEQNQGNICSAELTL